LSENLKYFSLANLANYDTKHTAMKFTRTDEEANRDLNQKLNDLKEKRRKVQETLFGY
jgi:predicted DNA binding CopG/RHH family protein